MCELPKNWGPCVGSAYPKDHSTFGSILGLFGSSNVGSAPKARPSKKPQEGMAMLSQSYDLASRIDR